jgi:hypothetical protein
MVAFQGNADCGVARSAKQNRVGHRATGVSALSGPGRRLNAPPPQAQMCHRARIPAGPSPSPGRVVAARSRAGSSGSACRSLLLRVRASSGAGFSDRRRSHRGKYWAIVIAVSWG